MRFFGVILRVVCVSRADGGWRSLCIKIGYSEPTRADKGPPPEPRALGWRNTRFWLADDSGDVILDFDWLTKLKVFFVLDSDWLPTILRFWTRAECVRQCIKIGNGLNDSFSVLWDFEKILWTFFQGPSADNYYGTD